MQANWERVDKTLLCSAGSLLPDVGQGDHPCHSLNRTQGWNLESHHTEPRAANWGHDTRYFSEENGSAIHLGGERLQRWILYQTRTWQRGCRLESKETSDKITSGQENAKAVVNLEQAQRQRILGRQDKRNKYLQFYFKNLGSFLAMPRTIYLIEIAGGESTKQ